MNKILGTAAASVLVFSLCVPFVSARDDRPTRSEGDTEVSTPAPTPTVPTIPNIVDISNDDDITNNNSANANTGGNSGGNVTTGDESVTVTVVNIGPTNNVTPEPQEEEDDEEENSDDCGDRSCRSR